MATASPNTKPGKLGDPSMTLLTEPRMNKVFVEFFKKDLVCGRGIVGKPVPFPLGPNSCRCCLHAWNRFVENCVMPKMLAESKMVTVDASKLESSKEVIKGVDGNQVTLYITKPKGVGTGPGIVHYHGGGMTFQTALDPMYKNYRDNLAMKGFTVVGVEFRNASGKLGNHPFPAGLNDCFSGLEWVHANRAKLGISKLLVHGESGGANLSMAVALKAKQEGKLDMIDGVVALAPYIGGPLGSAETKKYQSLRECNGYFIDLAAFEVCEFLYDPERKHLKNPLAWPLWAEPKDMEGLPPHLVNMNELDPLRDLGFAYAEKMKEAGVRVEQRMTKGSTHAAEILSIHIPGCEFQFDDVVEDMKKFVDTL